MTGNVSRLVRLLALVVPAGVAAWITLGADDDRVLQTAALSLVGLWVVMIGTLAIRMADARRPSIQAHVVDGQIVPPPHQPSAWDHGDALTATGAATLWLGAIALFVAGYTGFASLAVLGVLGMGLTFLAVIWVTLVAGGDQPWRRATIERAVLPEVATEGDPLREEVRFADVAIPAGMRLFATGQATKGAPITRYALGTEASGADVRLEAVLGDARRGEHYAAPLSMWLGDILGLARTPIVHRGEARFVVLPRPAALGDVRRLLGRGGDDANERPTQHLPTEGSFRIREYAPGDDTRRIHWMRSVQMDRLVVRLPDEVPHAEPAVRLVLDNQLAFVSHLTTRAPDDLLDALVRVWLGVGKSLAERGTRVTLATGAFGRDGWTVAERSLQARPSREALRLGARAAWQDAIPLGNMLAKRASGTRHVVIPSRPRHVAGTDDDIIWVIVPEATWTVPEPWQADTIAMTLPFPIGAPDNRIGRRLRERRRIARLWRDRAEFTQLSRWNDWLTYRGAYLARPDDGRVELVVIP